MSETISLHMCIPLAAVLLAALTDLKSFKIHNIVSIPLLFSGMAYHAMAHGWEAFAASLLGALFGFFVLMPLYIAGGMGAGDVKLLAAVGAWLGLPQTFYVFVASSLAAGIYALALMTWYQTGGEIVGNLKIIWHRMKILGRHLAQEDRIEETVLRTDRRGRLIPFGAMIALGLIAIVVWGLLKQGQ